MGPNRCDRFLHGGGLDPYGVAAVRRATYPDCVVGVRKDYEVIMQTKPDRFLVKAEDE